MKLFKSYTYTWWQIGIFKLALLSIGALAGAYWHEFFSKQIMLLTAIAILSTIYIIYLSLKQQ